VGFVVDKVALGQVFPEYLGSPCQFSFPQLLHTHHLSSGAGKIGQLVADVPSGLSLTPPQETKKKNNRASCFYDRQSEEVTLYVPPPPSIKPSGLFPVRINVEL
jgi:hypothetical protein